MVSKNPNPTEDFYLDPSEMALHGLGPFVNSSAAAATTVSSSEDPSKKIRKPYTITKSRQSWTEPEHDKFLEAIQLFDRDWKKIEAFIGSKTAIQIRSHAQKYFLKAQKNGTGEHLPPPRPKRKAVHPYPQKAPKNASVDSQVSGSLQSSPVSLDAVCDQRFDSPSMPRDHIATAASASTWTNYVSSTLSSNQPKGMLLGNNCRSSSDSTQRTKSFDEVAKQVNHGHPLRVLPDFARVYGFIGSVFDPNTTDHLQKLRKMDPIDVETVLLLMRNLSINLMNPDFEDHRRLLSSYEVSADAINASKYDNQPKNVA